MRCKIRGGKVSLILIYYMSIEWKIENNAEFDSLRLLSKATKNSFKEFIKIFELLLQVNCLLNCKEIISHP